MSDNPQDPEPIRNNSSHGSPARKFSADFSSFFAAPAAGCRVGGELSQRLRELWKGRSSHRALGRLTGMSDGPLRWGESGWNPDSVLFTVVCGPGTYSPNHEVTCQTCARPEASMYGAKSCH